MQLKEQTQVVDLGVIVIHGEPRNEGFQPILDIQGVTGTTGLRDLEKLKHRLLTGR